MHYRWLVRIGSFAADSLAACMAFCTENSACIGFGFNPRRMTCDLRRARSDARYIIPVVSGNDRRVTGTPRWDTYFLHAECFPESESVAAQTEVEGAGSSPGSHPTPQDKE